MTDAAKRLFDYREEHGLTQEQFASAIRRITRAKTDNQQSVANWELRRKRPGLANAAAIERLTGIPGVSWLKVKLEPVRVENRRAGRAA